MKIAVFSDIHGNYVAFQTCLEYALERGIDTFIFLGDYLAEFPYPQKTMEIIYSLKEKYTCFFIKGNKEDYWLNRKYDDNCEWKNENLSVGALHYTYANQTERDFTFYESLAICKEIVSPGAAPLLACHGSPNRNDEKMLPDHDATKRTMEECDYKYLLCGHTHLQGIIEHGNKMVLNPGAVGVSLHSGGKAQFMILHQNMHEWKHEFVSLDYDKEKVIKEIQESGLDDVAPYWSAVTKHLILTGEVSHGAVLKKARELCKEENVECAWYNVPDRFWERAVRELIM